MNHPMPGQLDLVRAEITGWRILAAARLGRYYQTQDPEDLLASIDARQEAEAIALLAGIGREQ